MSRYYQYPYWQLPYELMIIPDTDSLMLLGVQCQLQVTLLLQ